MHYTNPMETKLSAAEVTKNLNLLEADSLLESISKALDAGRTLTRQDFDRFVERARAEAA